MGRHINLLKIFGRLSEDAENEGVRWESLNKQVMKSWFVVRKSKTFCFVFNAALSPGGGMIVTICVAFMATKVGCSSLLHQNDEGGNLTFYVQCIFILVGWILMLWRWFKAVLYWGNSSVKEVFFFVTVLCVVPAIVPLSPLFLWLVSRLASFLKNPKFTLKGILISVPCLVPLLLLCVLILPVSFLSFFCFTCWYLLTLVFGSQFVQHLCKLDESFSGNEGYLEFKSMIHADMFNEETIPAVWMVNKKSFYRIKRSIAEASKIEQNCIGLLSVMGSARLAEDQRLRLHDDKIRSWMEAVSSMFKAIADIRIGVDMEDAFKAYKETKDVLKFVDCPDNVVVDPLNIFGTLNLESFFKSMICEFGIVMISVSFQKKPEKVERVLTPEDRARVDNFIQGFNGMFGSPSLIRSEECFYDNVEELGKMLRKLVGDVIVSGLLEAPDVLVKYTKKWAENLDETKNERSIELAGKVSALLERLVQERNVHSKKADERRATASEGDDIEAAIGPGE
ncbi:hypothetical protein SUGI_0212460 [Cryptomeria japonica]|nr:hypothetical protein SUGI_0212460 [Cryptomeria japonica]